jgi:hypothetical protein
VPTKDRVDGVNQQTKNGHFHDKVIQNWKAFSHQRNEVEKAIDSAFQKNSLAVNFCVNYKVDGSEGRQLLLRGTLSEAIQNTVK